MTSDVSERSAVLDALGVRPIINGAGPATRLGGMSLDPRVVEAMRDASERCVRMEELHRAAGAFVASVVGTESALVTCGAGAALVLGVAACMTGYDAKAINQLPRTAGLRSQVVMLRSQRYPYDRLLGAVGAEIVEVGYYEWTHLHEIEAALTDDTAAFLYYPTQPSPSPPLQEIVAVCHRREIPVIVDAALEPTPPVIDARWVAAGADLITFSGGKRLGGPQASGCLCGRGDLVEPAMLHMLDMDVRVETWVERRLIEDGVVTGPPGHGLGRSMKVGKEEIAGFVRAVDVFAGADHAARARNDAKRLRGIAAALRSHPGITVTEPAPTDLVPRLIFEVDEGRAGFDAWALLRHLQDRETPVHLYESFAWRGAIAIDPATLRAGEEHEVHAAIEAAIVSLRAPGSLSTG
jgi:D-glucosaminate-6-phosphate ammonia-lyase